MVFQNYALYPHMTVSQNLAFGLKMLGEPKRAIRQKVRDIGELLGIEALLDRKPRQLSGGQRQRVAMGRALVRRPKLFLLDEPLSNLDARLRINLRLELKRLHRILQTTILYVTHDQAEAMILGDKVVVMRQGHIHQIGRPETVYNHPADTFVAKFMGHPTMNVFKGKLMQKGSVMVFHGKDFSLSLEDVSNELNGAIVEMGIRPEHIVIGKESANQLIAEVEMTSNLGAEKYIHARIGNSSLTVRYYEDNILEPGEVIPLAFAPSKIQLFQDGKSLQVPCA
jgi:ABC-type sugar transport system ATPase subunit